MVQDNWHDYGATSSRNFVLSGSGVVTEQAGAVYMSSTTPFEISDFDGKVSLIGLMFSGVFTTHPGTGSTRLLALGLDGGDAGYELKSSSNLVVANVLNQYFQPTVAINWQHKSNQIRNGCERCWLKRGLNTQYNAFH